MEFKMEFKTEFKMKLEMEFKMEFQLEFKMKLEIGIYRCKWYLRNGCNNANYNNLEAILNCNLPVATYKYRYMTSSDKVEENRIEIDARAHSVV